MAAHITKYVSTLRSDVHVEEDSAPLAPTAESQIPALFEPGQGAKTLMDQGAYVDGRPQGTKPNDSVALRADGSSQTPKHAPLLPLLDEIRSIGQLPAGHQVRFIQPWVDAIAETLAATNTRGTTNSGKMDHVRALSPADQVEFMRVLLHQAEFIAKQTGRMNLSKIFALQRVGAGTFSNFDFDGTLVNTQTPITLFHKETGEPLDIPTLEFDAKAKDAFKPGGEWVDYEIRLAKLGSGKVETEQDRELLRQMGLDPDVVQYAPARLGLDSFEAFMDWDKKDDSLGSSLDEALAEKGWEGPALQVYRFMLEHQRETTTIITARGARRKNMKRAIDARPVITGDTDGLPVKNHYPVSLLTRFGRYGVSSPTKAKVAILRNKLDDVQARPFGPASVPITNADASGKDYVHPFVFFDDNPGTTESVAKELGKHASRWPHAKIIVVNNDQASVVKQDGTTRPMTDQEWDEVYRTARGVKPALLLSDLDGTWLSGDKRAEQTLASGVQQLKREYMERGIQLLHGYVTARPPERVVGRGLPEPDVTITYNGGEIHYGWPLHSEGNLLVDDAPIDEWEANLDASGYDPSVVQRVVDEVHQRPEFAGLELVSVGDIVNNPAADASRAAVHLGISLESITPGEGENPEDFDYEGEFVIPSQVKAFKKALEEALSGQTEVGMSAIYPFKGAPYLMIDIASPIANKGDVVEFASEHFGVDPTRLMVAGDGGNDIEMMEAHDGRFSIVVGPEGSQLRERVKEIHNVILRPSDEASSLGVLGGIQEAVEKMIDRLEAQRPELKA